MYKIAQIGTFDLENFGDILFPDILKNELSRSLTDIYVDLFSPKGGIKPFSDQYVFPISMLCQKCEEEKYDAIIIGGGDLIRFDETVAVKYQQNDNTARLWLTPILAAIKYNIPIYFNAVGVPFEFNKNEAKLIKYFIDTLDFVSVRDNNSRKFIALTDCNADIKIVPDTVWAVEQLYSKEHVKQKVEILKKEFGISENYMIFQLNSFENGVEPAEYARILKELSVKLGLKIVFMPIGYVHSDFDVMKEIFNIAGDNCIFLDRKLSPEEMLSMISGAALFIGTSLHGCLTSCVFDVPCVGINHLNLSKIEGFFNMTKLTVLDSVRELESIVTIPDAVADSVKENCINSVNAHFENLAKMIIDNRKKNKTADLMCLTDLITDFPEIPTVQSKACTVYFDTGSGYNEHNKSCFEYKNNHICITFDVSSDVKSIRFDPVEGTLCVLEALKLFVGAEKAEYSINGGEIIGEYVVFSDTTDPSIVVELPEMNAVSISIDVYVYEINSSVEKSLICSYKEATNEILLLTKREKSLEQAHLQELELRDKICKDNIVKCKEELMLQINTLTQKVATQESQIIRLNQQSNNYFGMYNTVVNSFCWKVTKPIRIVFDGIKAIPFIGKSIRYVRLLGMKAFLKKVLSKIKKKKSAIKVNSKITLVESGTDVKTVDKTVSVVIPTFNGENDLKILLKMLCNQKGFKRINLVIVDSGSKDNTVALCKEYGAKVIQIKQEEFSHSYARNLGGENADGDYLLIMTQDALPSSDRWLYNLYCALENGDNIAAVSCREFVKSDADLYYRVFTAHHYSYLGVLENDAVFTMPDNKDSDAIRRNAQLSDITCFMKRETFLKYKYRGGFAEDLDLGMRLIEDGYNLAFLGNEVSIHSHNRDAYYYLKRRFVELLTLEEIFSNQVAFEYSYQMTVNETVYILYYLQNFLKQRYTSDAMYRFEEFKSDFNSFIRSLNQCTYPEDVTSVVCSDDSFDEKTGKFFEMCVRDYKPTSIAYEGVMVNASIGYFDIVMSYMEKSYETVNKDIIDEFVECCYKILTGVCGTFFAYSYLSHENEKEEHDSFYKEIGAGV